MFETLHGAAYGSACSFRDLLFLFLYRDQLGATAYYFGWQFWLSVALGHCVSVLTVLTMSLIALFVQEASSIF